MGIARKGEIIKVMQPGGMNLADPTKGTGWIQNLNHYQGAWSTRDGFGVMGIYDSQMILKAPVPTGSQNKGPLNLGHLEVCGTYAFMTDFGHQQILTLVKTQGNDSILSHNFPAWTPVPEIKEGLEKAFYSVIIYDATTEEYLEEPLYRKTTEIQTPKETATYPTSPTPKEYIGSAVNVGKQHGAQESSYIPYKNFADLKDTTVTTVEPSREYELKNLPPVFFAQYKDRVLFGTQDLGVYAYTPCIFSEERLKRVENYITKTFQSGYSETSCIKKVVFTNGISQTLTGLGYNYFRNSEVGVIVDLCVWEDRVVYLTLDNSVLFSSTNELYAIIDADFDIVSTEDVVTAISNVNGRLMIFTQTESFVLQPVEGQVIAAGGRITKVSETVGCAHCASKVRQSSFLWWMDKNGAYISGGSADIKSVSEPQIDKFFQSTVENAFTNYYTNSGWTTLDNDEQPQLNYSFDPEGLQVVWDDVRKHIVWNFTQQHIALIFSVDNKEWYLWNFATMVDTVVSGSTTVPTVGSKQNLGFHWMSFNGDRLFGTFVDKQAIDDSTKSYADTNTNPTGLASGGSYTSFSFYMTEYGRGGSLDRSNSLSEEHRKIASGYVRLLSASLDTALVQEPTYFFEKGFWRESPFQLPSGAQYVTGSGVYSDSIFWQPLALRLQSDPTNNQYEPPNVLTADFRFDKTHWRPAFNATAKAASGIWQLDVDFPNERTLIAAGFGAGSGLPVAGTAEIACYNSQTGVTSESGDEIRVRFNGGTITSGTYSKWPFINVGSYSKSPIVYMPFRRKLDAENAFSLGITPCVAPVSAVGFSVQNTTGSGGRFYTKPASAFAWMETCTYPNMKATLKDSYGGGNIEASQVSNLNAQAVDWLYKSQEIGNGEVGLKPRGTIAEISSRGSATSKIDSTWPLGLYNILVSTNNKQYQGQILDYETSANLAGGKTKDITPANQITENKDTNISSIMVNSSDSVIKKTFGTTGLTMGDSSVSATGNYLIDSEIFVNKTTSDGTRGDRFSYTFFGHVRNAGEKLVIKGIDAVYRVIGSIRRK